MTLAITIPATQPPPAQATEKSLWGEDGLGFKDVLDAINPLQQLPIISNIYRDETGETISAASRMIGGALLGGPIGFLFAFINSAIEAGTGKDIGGNIVAALDSDEEREIQVASIDAPGAPSPTNRAAYEAYQKMNSMMA